LKRNIGEPAAGQLLLLGDAVGTTGVGECAVEREVVVIGTASGCRVSNCATVNAAATSITCCTRARRSGRGAVKMRPRTQSALVSGTRNLAAELLLLALQTLRGTDLWAHQAGERGDILFCFAVPAEIGVGEGF